jgi:hypothetical protein
MILYDLRCPKGHTFEAWFRDSGTYEAQAAAGEVPCPTCGSTKVEKALMAPNVSGAKKKHQEALPTKATMETKQAAEMRKALVDMRQKIEDNFDYVGGGFAEEARKIHYGEADSRNIYGETTSEEASSLDDEGIEVQRVPWLPRNDS